jgi:large subunit ribosomal protein L9
MATKTLKILLKERIAHIGKEGDIVEVSLPQARNYYLPKGLAIEATPALIATHEQKKKQDSDKNRKMLENRFQIQKTLHAQKIEMELLGSKDTIF